MLPDVRHPEQASLRNLLRPPANILLSRQTLTEECKRNPDSFSTACDSYLGTGCLEYRLPSFNIHLTRRSSPPRADSTIRGPLIALTVKYNGNEVEQSHQNRSRPPWSHAQFCRPRNTLTSDIFIPAQDTKVTAFAWKSATITTPRRLRMRFTKDACPL